MKTNNNTTHRTINVTKPKTAAVQIQAQSDRDQIQPRKLFFSATQEMMTSAVQQCSLTVDMKMGNGEKRKKVCSPIMAKLSSVQR
ncbi:hypothetical protein VTH06DRAFT_2606 [Thermothelomyces fergusii]